MEEDNFSKREVENFVDRQEEVNLGDTQEEEEVNLEEREMNLGERAERDKRQHTQVDGRDILLGDVFIIFLSIPPEDSHDHDLFLINNKNEIIVIIRDEIKKITIPAPQVRAYAEMGE